MNPWTDWILLSLDKTKYRSQKIGLNIEYFACFYFRISKNESCFLTELFFGSI